MMFKKAIVLFLFLFIITSTDAHALLHYFKNAKKAEAAGDYDKALNLYNKIFERYPYEIKTILKAYGQILRIYKINGEEGSTNKLLTYLKSIYPDKYFDLKDIEKLSLIYSKFDETEEALKLQWGIINDASYSPVYGKAILRTYARLLKYYREKGDDRYVSDLLKRLSALSALSAGEFDEKDAYEQAMLILNYGDKRKAQKMLKDLVQIHPNTLSSRKALFVLAEDAQKAKDYDSAIEYYVTYIERYPKNTFYVQKAYQRMADCYIAMGGEETSKETMADLADWINGVSNYRSQLNLSIDLKSRNMDKLAEVTFHTGYSGAIKTIEAYPGSYYALKAHLEITRAAHAVGKYGIAKQSADKILKDFGDLKGNAKLDKNVDFIKSQAYLWRAQMYREDGNYGYAIRTLEDFLRLYPGHKDKEHAVYEIGRSYEEKGDKGKAKGYYMRVNKGHYKSRAKERLAELQ